MLRRGFTLIELIVVILLLGVVGLGVTSLVRFGAQIFADVVDRDEVLSSSRFVLERLNRELREALPNSVREFNNGTLPCLEFIPVKARSYYTDAPFAGSPAAQLQAIPPSSYEFEAGDMAVSYPSVVGAQPDIYAGANKRFSIASYTTAGEGSLATFTFASPLTFARSSPARRLYVVREPVSYCVSAGRMYRFADYGYATTQSGLGMGSGVLMAEGIVNVLSSEPVFSVTPATLTRNGQVTLWLRFAFNEGEVQFNHEVHIANAP